MIYPTISEYIDSIKNAESNLVTLTDICPVYDKEGSIIMYKGDNSIVFKMENKSNGKQYAIKCFTKEQEGREDAYNLISEEIAIINGKASSSQHSYFVNVKYYKDELLVKSNKADNIAFPILVMDWVNGDTLDELIKQYVNGAGIYFVKIALDFIDLAYWMSQHNIAHGNIKPDNIIVTRSKGLFLVDYDGMFVPKMKGQKPREFGSPNYQHPNRQIDLFDSTIDDFSLCVMAFSLTALVINKDVYKVNGEDAIILKDKDYKNLNNIVTGFNRVLHDKICSTLFSSLLLLLGNPCFKIDYDKLFNLKSYITQTPPLILPFKLNKKSYLLYNTKTGLCISSQIFSDVRFLSEKRNSTSLLVSIGGEYYISDNKFVSSNRMDPNAKFALLSNDFNVNDLQWYKYISTVSPNIILSQNTNGLYGIISAMNEILVPFVYKSISDIVIQNNVFLICENSRGERGLFIVDDDNRIINELDVKYNDQSWHYDDEISNPTNIILFKDGVWRGFDLERACIVDIPNRFSRVKAYSEQILCVEQSGINQGIKLFNVESKSFINKESYETVGVNVNDMKPFNNGLALCETNYHKNVVVFKDGSTYIIPYESHRLDIGKNCKYIFYHWEKIRGHQIKEGLKITLFDWRKKTVRSFIYDKYLGPYGVSVVDDKYIEIYYYDLQYDEVSTVALLDLEGNVIKRKSLQEDGCLQKELSEESLFVFTDEMILRHIITSKFINKEYVSDYDQYIDDFFVDVKNGYAIVEVSDEFGFSSKKIGYADSERCYWLY